jgi:hypothetical protein
VCIRQWNYTGNEIYQQRQDAFSSGLNLFAISFAKPSQLKRIFVIVKSEQDGDAPDARTVERRVRDWLCQNNRIVRQGSTYTIPLLEIGGGTFSGAVAVRVVVTDPVLQGYVSKSSTNLFVLRSKSHRVEFDADNKLDGTSELEDAHSVSEECEEAEIDERFLSNALGFESMPHATDGTERGPSQVSTSKGFPIPHSRSYPREFLRNSGAPDTEMQSSILMGAPDMTAAGIFDREWVCC